MRHVQNFCRIASLLAGSSVMAFATPALAEGAAPAGLEEIVVTAQKREQNLQAVPIAISAISADKVERLGIKDARDLSGLAPNVTITQGTTSGAAAVISIRGIPTPAAETFGIDTSNALYIDGIYIARSGASGLGVTDVERVEVLRGPQGTLFGRNTTGGAIAFISRAPSKDFRLKADAGYGNFGAWNGHIAVDPGEIAGISTSFSYAHRQRNGVIDNILQPDKSKDPGAFESDSFRAAARVELGGTGHIQYIFDWTKQTAYVPAFQLTNVSDGALRAPIVIDGQPTTVVQPAPVQQYMAGVTFAQPACAALSAPTRVYRQQVCNDITSSSLDKTWGHNLQVENDFGPFKAKLTTGYRQWVNDSISDLDGLGAFSGPAFTSASTLNGMPVSLLNFIFPTAPGTATFLAGSAVPRVTQNLFDTSNQRRHKQLSSELEISGRSDSLEWVVGAFYFWEKGSENNPQNSGFVLDTNAAVFTTRNFGGLAPSLQAANPARYRLVQTATPLIYSASAESKAIYGQFTFYPGGRDSGLRLTAGGRYTWDSKHMMRTQNGTAPFAAPQIADKNFSKFTWNLMVGYDIADGVSTYARVATGYRAGGFNAGETNVTGKLTPFGWESVTSYEVGLKSEFFNRRLRLNVAGYYNDYRDFLVSLPVTNAPPGTFATVLGNAGKVQYTGFEIEAAAVLSDNFTLDGSLGYVHTKFKDFLAGQNATTGLVTVNIAPIVVPAYTSPVTANAALNFQFPLKWGEARLVGRVGYTYEDGKYSFTSVIASPFNKELKGDNRSLVDAQIGIDRISIGGAQGEIRLWGKNLTNGKDFVRGVDFGPLGFAGGYYADPRTYGVTIGIKY